MAGHQAEQVIEKHFTVGHALLVHQMIDDGLENGPRGAFPEDRRITRKQQGAAAEIFHPQPQLAECLPLFQSSRRLLGRQVDGLRDQEPLCLQRA